MTNIPEGRQGDEVLITVLSGGVGHLAVQIIGRPGARVVGTASRRNHNLVRALGAEMLIDYMAKDIGQLDESVGIMHINIQSHFGRR
jgi:NADPH:quinone reductase-like Zn-dependent oxidoreductase